MKTIRIIALALLFCLLFLCGCSGEEPETYSLLKDLLTVSDEDFDGSGYVYSSRAREGDAEYILPDTLADLYGEKYIAEIGRLVEEYAIFLSSRGVGEIAVFKCYSRSDSDTVSTMLLERAEELKVALRNTEWAEKSGEIRIEVKGKYLLFAFTHRVEHICEDFQSLV